MDDNTFKLGLAFIAMIQVVALGYLGVRQQQARGELRRTHELVNSQSMILGAVQQDAAFAKGKLTGIAETTSVGVTAPVTEPVAQVAATAAEWEHRARTLGWKDTK